MTTISTSPPSCASHEVAARLSDVRRRIERAGGDPEAVRILAVTKGFGPDAVRAAREVGLTDLGENYASELCAKAPGPAGTRWHFLGRVQRNKVHQLAPLVDVWQSVARLSEGARIAQYAPGAAVLVQVDLTALAGRNGCAPAEVPALVDGLVELGLAVTGLMTVAPQGDGAPAAFAQVARMADALGLTDRSMGMSDDLEAAVAAGTTMVRVGRALFGAR
ncbi:MAG TPA: YggS family pyridoxal phosphate enzyme [Acidimicrobiales bacterium]|nr:YggS family pyridoxal phosphate enzyme [Acidimicrobiales bacterium]